jgi:23S rRNA (cytidine1920-2'-O)/16S rRNA (cytidine1409-2'-O)-methyltransferase
MANAPPACVSLRNFLCAAAPSEIDLHKLDPEMPRSIKIEKERLDLLLVERNLAPSRQKAQAMILAGEVRVNGQRRDKPGEQVARDATIEVDEAQRYASRGGFKLEGALADFGVNPANQICLDIGSSTGGFTDCLLQQGAARVIAVDVTPEQMDWKLQQDSRVTRVHRNARELTPNDLPEQPSLVVIDVSFISVAKILPAVAQSALHESVWLILVKPQFELDRGDIGKGGIVRDALLHQKAIDRAEAAARASGLTILGVKPSHLVGAEGNQEFFLHARRATPA